MGAEIVHFADPLNPRGWVAEPTRRRVALAFPDVEWTVRPVGMVESWDAYDGAEIAGGRAGMAAACARLSERYGVPIDEYLWFDDPPTSSWPACRAIAAAGLLDDDASLQDDEVGGEDGDAGDRYGDGGGDSDVSGEGRDSDRGGTGHGHDSGLATRLLRACREATFARRRSVSDPAVLQSVVESVPDLDADAVAAAVDDGRAEAAFEDARAEAAAVDAPGVERSGGRCVLPTLVVRADGEARGVSGPAHFSTCREAIATVADVEPIDDSPGVDVVLERLSPEGWVARAELAVMVDRPEDEVEAAVGPLVETGGVVEETFAAEPFWRLAEFVPAADVDGGDDDSRNGAVADGLDEDDG